VLDRERNRSERKSGLKQNISFFEENSWLFDEKKGCFGQKYFWKGFSCKPTWMWASIKDDTRKSSFFVVDYFFLGQALITLLPKSRYGNAFESASN
jgi:hypothetical protein